MKLFGGGVIGNTAGSGPAFEGSSPSPRAKPQHFKLLFILTTLVLIYACSPSTRTTYSNTHVQADKSIASNSSLLSLGKIVLVNGNGWNLKGLSGKTFAAGQCHYIITVKGYYLPDPKCTPGSINVAITESNLESTICRRGGYTTSIRPPESLTEPAKYQMMSAYDTNYKAYNVEFDHLIPLSLGGSSDLQNLWPQPNQGTPNLFDPSDPYGINAKDGVEDALHNAVCQYKITLRQAQIAIASNWTTALSSLNI